MTIQIISLMIILIGQYSPSKDNMLNNNTKFSKYAWATLLYNLFVILFGAYVRATGSGAGCGAHWPLCNGEIIPRPERIETVIELTHRITSGFTLILAVILVILAWKQFPKGSIIRKTAVFVLFFTITEALVGAGLVLFGLVADNDSVSRAISMMVHLVNTFLLIGSYILTAWWSTNGAPENIHLNGVFGLLVLLGCVGILLLGASGAVTALGDTLYPSSSLMEGIQSDFSPASHYLIRLRTFHPGIAIGVGLYLFLVTIILKQFYKQSRVGYLTTGLLVLFGIQIIIGMLNVILLAPVWIQLVHLLQSNLIWMFFILLTGEVCCNLPARPIHQKIHNTV